MCIPGEEIITIPKKYSILFILIRSIYWGCFPPLIQSTGLHVTFLTHVLWIYILANLYDTGFYVFKKQRIPGWSFESFVFIVFVHQKAFLSIETNTHIFYMYYFIVRCASIGFSDDILTPIIKQTTEQLSISVGRRIKLSRININNISSKRNFSLLLQGEFALPYS